MHVVEGISQDTLRLITMALVHKRLMLLRFQNAAGGIGDKRGVLAAFAPARGSKLGPSTTVKNVYP